MRDLDCVPQLVTASFWRLRHTPPRKPTALLEASGAFLANPSRHRVDVTAAGPIGGPPEHLEPDEAAA